MEQIVWSLDMMWVAGAFLIGAGAWPVVIKILKFITPKSWDDEIEQGGALIEELILVFDKTRVKNEKIVETATELGLKNAEALLKEKLLK